jgi:hypothetical protein
VLLQAAICEKKPLQALEFLLGSKILLYAAADLVEKDVGSDAANGRVGSHKLRKDFITWTTFVDHLLNPPQLPFDTSKAMQDFRFLHHIPLGVY